MHDIYILIMDVDGTLTDGKIYMGKDGELMKAFNIKDGYGIHSILPNVSHGGNGADTGIIPVILTGRESAIVSNRCRELKISHIYQGVTSKVDILPEILSKISMELGRELACANIAYCGDDVNDLPIMLKIQQDGGVVGCPSDAAREVIEISNYICSSAGGNGAVREFIEWITDNKQELA